jgi:hypothetical protein
MVMKKYENDKKHLLFGHSTAVLDPEVIDYINNFNPNFNSILGFDISEYLNSFTQWILSSKNKTIIGLDNFKYSAYSNGTSESFDKFYLYNRGKRFRCFTGEYLYHKLAWRHCCPEYKLIEEEPLREGDAVVISLPFADTGNKHINHDIVLKECERLNIPVLIDCCYYGIADQPIFDLTSSCITDVTFSLSKVFPVAHARIGIRFTKDDIDDTLIVYDKNSYVNRLGASLGVHLMKKFGPDFIVNKYRDKQIEFCNFLGVDSSNTVIFGLGNETWKEYNRGCITNRLSLHKFLHLNSNEFYKIVREKYDN